MRAIPDDYPIRHITTKKIGESEAMTVAIEKYAHEQTKEKHIKLHYRYFDNIYNLGDSFLLYLYMCRNVTKKIGRYTFWNNKILPYYKLGYLPFAKHQRNIAQDLNLNQSTISRRIALLEKHELICEIGKEHFSESSVMTIHSVGRWFVDEDGDYKEHLYLQTFNYFT